MIIDLGDGHTAELLSTSRVQNSQQQPHPSGYGGAFIAHTTPDGRSCHSVVTWDHSHPPQITWTLNSLDPLDISPSVLCKLCGDHGFIRKGRWERA